MSQNQEFYFEVTVSWSQSECDYYIVKAKNYQEAVHIVNNRFRNPESHLPQIYISPNRYKLLVHE